jgi:hypothetical protein
LLNSLVFATRPNSQQTLIKQVSLAFKTKADAISGGRKQRINADRLADIDLIRDLTVEVLKTPQVSNHQINPPGIEQTVAGNLLCLFTVARMVFAHRL